MTIYTKLYTCVGMNFTIYLRLQIDGATESMQVRVAYRMLLRYLSQKPTLTVALQSKPQTASLWNSITEQSVWEAAKIWNRMALYMVAWCQAGTAPCCQNELTIISKLYACKHCCCGFWLREQQSYRQIAATSCAMWCGTPNINTVKRHKPWLTVTL